jgi:streptogramin lyase
VFPFITRLLTVLQTTSGHLPVRQGLCYNDILSCGEDNKGRIWIGTENGGISIFDYTTGGFSNIKHNITDPFSLSSNSVYCIYKDDSDGLWVGTWSAGVNFLPASGEKFTLYQKVPGNSGSLNANGVLSVSGDADGNIWIGTDGGGINFFDRKKKDFSYFTHNPLIPIASTATMFCRLPTFRGICLPLAITVAGLISITGKQEGLPTTCRNREIPVHCHLPQ